MRQREHGYAEYIKSSVPIAGKQYVYEDTQPDIENCSNGIAPQPNTTADGREKMTVPVVISMTKFLFDHYRLNMYSYLNNSLRSGRLKRIVGFNFINRTINREVCTFRGVNYWRMDRLNFWADVSVSLLLDTERGKREWRGYLSFWFSAENPGPLTGTIEEMVSEDEAPDRSGMTLLSPFLIPYFTSAKMDMEAEDIWATYVPGALNDGEIRKAATLANAMGLSIMHLPLHKHEGVNSILFLIDDSVQVSENGMPPKKKDIPANTIVVNTSIIKKEYSDFNILHECIHYYEHYLFFRLQEMHHNDILRMETQEVEIPEDGEKISNPVYWLEKQANRGAYGLMMPINFMRDLMTEKCRGLKPYEHEGEKYEQIGLAIADDLCLPHFRVRARMIQMGHVHAKGSLNYVDRNRIQPYSFDEASLRLDEHTFNIDRLTAGHLYEKNTDFRKVLDSGKFIYADGHIVRNEPRFVEQTPFGHMLTPWAVQRVDQCCLRFTRIYEQENVSKYIFGRMNYDPDYVKQTMFYLEDLINEKELDEIEAELQYKRNFPDTFLGAFDMLMKRNGDTRETMAEKLNTTSRTLYEWLKDPDRRINADFVVTIALLWRLPDWIDTMSGDGELMLSILASFFQEESRNVSENCKWRVRKKFEQGIPTGFQMYGYEVRNGVFTIIPEEAEVVRRIFRMYLDGMGSVRIMKTLIAEGIPAPAGGLWNASVIMMMLRNEKYAGDLLLQKFFTNNHIEKKQFFNRGELPQYFVAGDHEPIIDRETFEAVQAEIARRKAIYTANGGRKAAEEAEDYIPELEEKKLSDLPLGDHIHCGICGKKYRRKITRLGTPYAAPIWICGTFSYRGKAYCASKQIPEKILLDLIADVLGISPILDDQEALDSIHHIEMHPNNRVLFVFQDGHTEEHFWKDHSRRDSWDAEKRKKAAEKTKEQRKRRKEQTAQ